LGIGWPGAGRAAPGDFVEDDAEIVWHRAGSPGSSYGWAIAHVLDVDDDGVTDLAVGAPNHAGPEGPAGRVELLSGASGQLLWRVDGEPGDRLGYALSDAGDLDGDGTHDIIVGAPGAGGGDGRITVRSGADGSRLLDVAAPATGAFMGSAVAAGGDLDGDGQPDVVAGGERARGADDQPQGGAVWALDGAEGAVLWSAHGSGGEKLGSGTAWVGDLDGDGTPDPFVGASDAGPGAAGAARLLDGKDGAVRLNLSPDGEGADFGRFFVAGVGDHDDDGTPDLYVGDFGASSAGPGSGRVHLFSGRTGEALEAIDGAGAGEGFGPGRGAGDVDFDGVPDLIVGAYASSAGAAAAGRVFVLSTATGAVVRTFTSTEAGEQLGFDAVGLGDVDGDGDLDFAASGASGDNVYVLAGIGGPPGGDPTTGPSEGDAGGDGDGDGDGVVSGPGKQTAAGCSCRSEPALGPWEHPWWLVLAGLASALAVAPGLVRRR